MTAPQKKRAPRNRTITLIEPDRDLYSPRLLRLEGPTPLDQIIDRTICQDLADILDWLPEKSVDLLFVDPPYNLNKSFNSRSFAQRSLAQYEEYLLSWLPQLIPTLKPNASIYICADWRSSAAIQKIAEQFFHIRNRITWEREKGRGARKNFKNCTEDIWFCTLATDYQFNLDDVKVKRQVIAPYTHPTGRPKDWQNTRNGKYRLTHPSNIWTDLTVPFWSMPENTDHPAQKPEKLLAKIILASSSPGDLVLDPFLGSGTTSVVAKKLNRHFLGVEIDTDFCLLAEKRLAQAEHDKSIQGYCDNCFWERNSLNHR